MEGRMTVCNMSIEGGARAGLIAPDETTFNYLRGRRYAPNESEFDRLIEFWKSNLKSDENKRKLAIRALEYMDLEPGTPMTDVHVDRVFIGSCTNSRLEDLMEASLVIKGRKVSTNVRAMVVPGSQKVKLQAEEHGVERI